MKKILIKVIIALVIGGAGWYSISPLFIEKEVQEEFPVIQIPTEQELAEMTEEEVEKIRIKVEEKAAQMPDKMMEEETLQIDPVALTTGEFQGADSFHQGSGQATIYELVDGSYLLRLENFSVTNGPDLRVYLAAHPNPKTQSEIKSGEYIELAKLKGNKGNQNYEIPAGTDVSQFKSALIYCKPFHVLFSSATLNKN
jgi:hypothetical protein